jgi:hypothetical protein
VLRKRERKRERFWMEKNAKYFVVYTESIMVYQEEIYLRIL